MTTAAQENLAEREVGDGYVATPLTFRLPLPPSVNAYKRISPHGVPYSTARYRQWKKTAGWDILLQFKAQHGRTMTGDVAVQVQFERRGDIDNRLKPLLDLLQDMAVFKNDSQIAELHIIFREVEGCKVTVTPLNGTGTAA